MSILFYVVSSAVLLALGHKASGQNPELGACRALCGKYLDPFNPGFIGGQNSVSSRWQNPGYGNNWEYPRFSRPGPAFPRRRPYSDDPGARWQSPGYNNFGYSQFPRNSAVKVRRPNFVGYDEAPDKSLLRRSPREVTSKDWNAVEPDYVDEMDEGNWDSAPSDLNEPLNQKTKR